jgi:hypothetical protein
MVEKGWVEVELTVDLHVSVRVAHQERESYFPNWE